MNYISYLEKLSGIYPNYFRESTERNLTMINLDARLKMMDDCGIDLSILIPLPNLETAPSAYKNPESALKAARFINDAIAEIAAKNPRRFKGVALLPTTNAEVMLGEFERAVKTLKMAGGYFVVSPTAKPPDHPDFLQLYGKAAEYDVPLWIHPPRPMNFPDYTSDVPPLSQNNDFLILGWPYDSSVAMSRIVFKGVFNTYPNLKLIIHHRGGMIPFFASRCQSIYNFFDEVNSPQSTVISKPYIEHFKKFYVDTVCWGEDSALMKVAYDFFGPDRVLFGTDAPFSRRMGRDMAMASRNSVENMNVSSKAKEEIFSKNILKIIPG